MANAYAYVRIPAFRYYDTYATVSSSNDQLTFRDVAAGPDITVTLASGEYTRAGLAYEAKKKMSASGTGGAAVYTIRYRPNTRLYNFTSDLSGGASAFQIRVGGANDASALFGFTAHKTGAATYDSDTTVPALTTLTLTQQIRGPKISQRFAREDLILDSGASESSMGGIAYALSFYVENESVASIQGIYDMLRGAAGRGQSVRLYPDSTNTTDYVDVVFTPRDFDLPEKSDVGMYRHYDFACDLREAVPNTGTLNFRSLLDRRPNS